MVGEQQHTCKISYCFMKPRFYKKLTLLCAVLIIVMSGVLWQNYYIVLRSNGVKNFVINKLAAIYDGHSSTLPHCPIIPPELKGRITLNSRVPDWAVLEEENAMLNPGGRYKPSNCLSRNSVAIIVPYRDRETHLKLFLQHLHPFLQRQQLDYGIYVIEMAAGIPFNRALLMNVGYKVALQQYDYQCFIFHDVDLIPEDDRNLYACAHMPRHMSVAIDKEKYRVIYSNLTITRDIPQLSRYKMLPHKKEKPSPNRTSLLKDAAVRQSSDGLTSLKYNMIKKQLKRLYTWILVSVNVTKIQNIDTSATPKKKISVPKGQTNSQNHT